VLSDGCDDDGLRFDPTALRLRGIWQGTAFPGLRLVVRVGLERPDRDVQIDVGFNDPLVPAPELVEYPTLLGPPARLWCVRPETAVAWKLHGLHERGGQHWRPKDLHDLWLIGGRARPGELTGAVAAAFASRGDPVPAARSLLADADWWGTQSAGVRWREFRATVPDRTVPADLGAVVGRVRELLQPALERLPTG
jgi:hypothetical protein